MKLSKQVNAFIAKWRTTMRQGLEGYCFDGLTAQMDTVSYVRRFEANAGLKSTLRSDDGCTLCGAARASFTAVCNACAREELGEEHDPVDDSPAAVRV